MKPLNLKFLVSFPCSLHNKIQSRKKRKADELYCEDCKEKKLKILKHETIESEIELAGNKMNNNLIKTEVVETGKRRTKQLTDIQVAPVKVKTEYIEINTEKLDLEKKCAELGIKAVRRSSSEKVKCRKRVSGTHKRVFKPEEDQVLLDAVEQFGDQIDFKQIAKDLQRSVSSIRYRVNKLKTGKATKERRTFTIIEDKVILDAVLQHLNGQPLEMLTLSQSEWNEIGGQIGRDEVSARLRWTFNLRAWILQHYSGTLNLDIRRPLANFLAENFEDRQSIDWALVNTKPEFAGHTENSLRFLFSGLAHYAKNLLTQPSCLLGRKF